MLESNERGPIELFEWGIVYIGGKSEFSGRLGYYDDDDWIFSEEELAKDLDDESVKGTHVTLVYLTAPALPGACYTLLPIEDLRQATKDEKITFEMEHLAALPPEVRDRLGYYP